jgi:hypothetical protein
MRHSALGRHHRPTRVPFRSYILALLAAIALAVSIAGFAGASGAAVGSAKAPAIRAQAVADTSSLGDKAAASTAALTRVHIAAVLQHAAAVLAAHTYHVRSGDSLSGVALRKCSTARDWTGTYAASRARGWTAKNANTLTTGQRLYIACTYDPAQLRYAPAPPPPPVVHTAARVTYHHAVRHSYAASSGSGSGYGNVNPGSYSGFQACVISRESGGNSQVMNSSGHYGLYQFSAGTWAAYGGNPADFGHASAAEQTGVFNTAMAQGGQSNWSPYDGCL